MSNQFDENLFSGIITIDGIDYSIGVVKISRKANVFDKYAKRTVDGDLHREIIGVYYNYEIYASKTQGFTPNSFDIIHAGQTSSFLFQAKPNEIWYFRACAINTHGQRTEFSDEIEVITTKVDDLENYFSSAAIGNAVVGSLNSDYMEAGIIKGRGNQRFANIR